jgi:hypothetical protein
MHWITTCIYVSASPLNESGGWASTLACLPHYVILSLYRILTISTCAKLYFTVFLYDNLCLNELVKADVYYPIFSIFRLCCLTVTKNFVSPGSLIYVIVVMQFISSLYKYFHILYHNPET